VKVPAENKNDDQTPFMTNWSVYSTISLSTVRNVVGRFECKAEREYIFKSTVGNDSVPETSEDTGARTVNCCTAHLAFTVTVVTLLILFVRDQGTIHTALQRLGNLSPNVPSC